LGPERSTNGFDNIDWSDVSSKSHLINSDRWPVEHAIVSPLLRILSQNLVVPLPKLVRTLSLFKTVLHTLYGLRVLVSDPWVGLFGALFRNEFVALLVHILHVVPPKRLDTILNQLSVQTNLSKVLHYNVSALDKQVCGLIVVRSTILPITEAFLLFEIRCTCRTAPSHKPWREM